MHQRFKDKFTEFSLTLKEVEQKIECPQNYLSQFINGTRDLPKKWETKIDAFLDGITQHLKKLEAPPPNPDLLRPWIKKITDYCRSVGIYDPEELIEAHKQLIEFKKQPKTQVANLTPNPAKTNYTVNTGSSWSEERRKKKCGF